MRLGRYEVAGEIARGGGGAVFRARPLDGGAEVAIKLVHLGGAAPALRLARFGREVEVLRRLSHPAIVRVLDHGEHQGQPYLVLELLSGASLQERLERGPLPVREAGEIALALAGALGHAHARGIVHRDVKPANVLLSSADAPRLTDFGLALDLDPERTRLSQTGHMMGTPGFMAPEQALGRLDAIGPPADVYGLGATLYALLTGVPPFAGQGLSEVLVATAERRPARPSELRAGVDPVLDGICLGCLAKDPGARPDARELERQLAAWVQGRPLRAASPHRRLRVAAAGLLGVGLTLAAFTAGRLVLEPGPPARVPAAPASAAAPGPSAAPGDAVPAPPAASAAPAPEAAAVAEQEAAAAADREFLAAMQREGPPLPSAMLAAADAALARDPDRAPAWLLRASALSALGRGEESIEAARRAVELVPGWLRAWRSLGAFQALGVPGQGKEGLASLERALELGPGDPETLRLHGWTLATQGRLDEARADLDRALTSSPGLTHARHLRGWVALRQGDLTAAVADLEQAVAEGAGEESRQLLEQARSRLAGDAPR